MVFNLDDKPSDIKRVCYSCNKNSSDVNTEYITCKAWNSVYFGNDVCKKRYQ